MIPTSDAEEALTGVGEITVPTSPPQFPALQGTTTSSVTQAVASSVIYTCQMEADTAMPTTIARTSGSRERWFRRQGEPDRQYVLDHLAPEMEHRRITHPSPTWTPCRTFPPRVDATRSQTSLNHSRNWVLGGVGG